MTYTLENPTVTDVEIVFGFTDYQQYMHFCNKMQVMPVDLKTFFG